MDKADFKLLYETYGKVETPSLLIEVYNPDADMTSPSLIKISEVYRGGPHEGNKEVVYKIVAENRDLIRGICIDNSELTCEMSVNDPDVVLKEGAYHITAVFDWNDKRKTYQDISSDKPRMDQSAPETING